MKSQIITILAICLLIGLVSARVDQPVMAKEISLNEHIKPYVGEKPTGRIPVPREQPTPTVSHGGGHNRDYKIEQENRKIIAQCITDSYEESRPHYIQGMRGYLKGYMNAYKVINKDKFEVCRNYNLQMWSMIVKSAISK